MKVDTDAAQAIATRRKAFRALHEQGCFVSPNPWDVGSARYLQHLGFHALATTSAGFAFSQGVADSGDELVMSRDRNLAYIADIAAAVDLPVSADFMSGYGEEPEDVAESVARCIATGVAGLSIEDSTGDSSSPLCRNQLPVCTRPSRAPSPLERSMKPTEVHWGRSESLDPDDVGDIADEGAGHRG